MTTTTVACLAFAVGYLTGWLLGCGCCALTRRPRTTTRKEPE